MEPQQPQQPHHHPGPDQPPPQRGAGGSGAAQPHRDDRRRAESSLERSLRALVSTRTTQLTPTVAMRAREVASPSAADLAAAEQELQIVRRHYVPPAPLATTPKKPQGADRRAQEGRAAEAGGRLAERRRGGSRSVREPPE